MVPTKVRVFGNAAIGEASAENENWAIEMGRPDFLESAMIKSKRCLLFVFGSGLFFSGTGIPRVPRSDNANTQQKACSPRSRPPFIFDFMPVLIFFKVNHGLAKCRADL